MAADPSHHDPPGVDALRARIDGTLGSFLAGVRAEMAARATEALLPIDEVDPPGRGRRQAAAAGVLLLGLPSGGRRRRRAHRACRRRARAAPHDGVDPRRPHGRSAERRGRLPRRSGSLPSRRARTPATPTRVRHRRRRWWRAISPRCWPTASCWRRGSQPDRLAGALEPVSRGCGCDMALGQCLDVAGLADDPDDARRAAALKGGAYTVDGPLSIGAALAGAGRMRTAALVPSDGRWAWRSSCGRPGRRRGDVGADAGSGRGPGSAGASRVGSAPGSIPRRSARSASWPTWWRPRDRDLEFLRRAFRDVPSAGSRRSTRRRAARRATRGSSGSRRSCASRPGSATPRGRTLSATPGSRW